MGHHIVDAFAISKKHNVMADTWGHLYPEPGSKYPGHIIYAQGEYGDTMIVSSDFPGIESSPMRHEIEHSICWMYGIEDGVWRIDCSIWFYKTCGDMYLGSAIGRLIKMKWSKLV